MLIQSIGQRAVACEEATALAPMAPVGLAQE